MVGAKIHKQALESLYEDEVDVYEYRQIPDGCLTRTDLVCTFHDLPCRLSYKNLPAGTSKSGTTALSQEIKLFLAPEWEIHPGSKLILNHNGRTVAYKSSGEPALYESHQEIMLELWKERA